MKGTPMMVGPRKCGQPTSRSRIRVRRKAVVVAM
jgi:hypothetical protein